MPQDNDHTKNSPVTYRRISRGRYHAVIDGVTVAQIERTGDENGWKSTWWWEPLQKGVTGLQTASTLNRVKELGEAWLRRLDAETDPT